MVIIMLKIKNNFDLKNTITCDQIFRYEEVENGYYYLLFRYGTIGYFCSK